MNEFKTQLIIIKIIAPLSILNEDEWGDLECLYKACQAPITDGGLFTDTGVDERGENERKIQGEGGNHSPPLVAFVAKKAW